ncbi:MAG TPA: NAD-dependent epimerase/dehydratase family protein, partial [Pararhizobium sp.]|uniref:NAD-dependent epimerase/dehydratase family protein n=1 Tax=Pararhizobium sp. TaxID=1977563 RepID=UPI002C205196
MNILIIGAAGMLGRKLVQSLVAKTTLQGRPIRRLVLADIVAPEQPAFDGEIETVAADLSLPGTAERLIQSRPDLICHLAAVVSGEAEADFEKGYSVNLDGTRSLFEAIRLAGKDRPYCPKVVFTSSIVVFGEPLPDIIDDNHCLTPLTSYGTQKAIGE